MHTRLQKFGNVFYISEKDYRSNLDNGSLYPRGKNDYFSYRPPLVDKLANIWYLVPTYMLLITRHSRMIHTFSASRLQA